MTQKQAIARIRYLARLDIQKFNRARIIERRKWSNDKYKRQKIKSAGTAAGKKC
jgi:hypothetical protein